MKKTPVIVVGLFFCVGALLNLLRVIFDVPIIVGNWFVLPGWTGAIGFIVASLIAIWLFRALRCPNKPKEP